MNTLHRTRNDDRAARPAGRLLAAAAAAALAAAALLFVSSASAQAPTTLTLSVPSDTVGEDAGSVTVTATLDRPAPEGGVQVTLTSRAIAGRASPGYHFSLPPAFTIAENTTSATAVVTIHDNVFVEPDRPVVLDATVDVAGVSVTGVTFTLANDDAPRLTGIHVLIGSGVEADDDFGRLPRLALTPSFDGLTQEFQARANPDVQHVTLFVTGGVDRGSIKIGLRGSLEQATVIPPGNSLSKAIALSDGENVIDVERSLHGKTSTYTVTVTRGLLPAPSFSVTRGARNGEAAVTVTLTQQPSNVQEMRVQVRESTTDPWPAATANDLLPAGASSAGFSWTFRSITISGLAAGTAYEVRAHLIELGGSPAELTSAVASLSSAEAQVTTLSPAPAPTGLTLTPTPPGKGFSRAIAARWNAVNDGSPTMRYHLRWRLAGQTPEAEWSSYGPFTHTSQVTSVLESDGTYDVQAASDNGISPIAWSEIGQATVNHSGGL